MTDEEAIVLGQRAVGCKGWRWIAGMRAIDTTPRTRPSWDTQSGPMYWDTLVGDITLHDGAREVITRKGYVQYWYPKSHVPNLQDPATLGCLVALTREAFGVPFLPNGRQNHGTHRFYVDVPDGTAFLGARGHSGKTEAEAWIAALESAP